MKKIIVSILSVLMLIAGLFVLTGCGKSNENSLTKDGYAKAEFVDLMYKEPTNFVKKENLIDQADMKTLVYRLDNTDENISVNLYYNKGKNYEYLTDSNDKYTEKEINGTTWRILHDDDFGKVTDTYYVVHNNGLYSIELNGIDKKADMASFMNEVSFK